MLEMGSSVLQLELSFSMMQDLLKVPHISVGCSRNRRQCQ
jgi:hypothetical protein